MRHIVEGGTDGGSMLLFDPEALPDDYDQKAKGDPAEMLEVAMLSGSAFWINTNGDGGYLLHLFVDELPPDDLAPFLRDEEKVHNFRIPSGRLYFTGVEYGFRNDDSSLKKYPHMGERMDVEPGEYRLSIYHTEYPEGLMEDQLRRRVSPTAYRIHRSMGLFAMLAFVGLVGVGLSILKTLYFPVLALVGAGLISLPFVVYRLSIYRKTDAIWAKIQRAYPSIVAVLSTIRAEGESAESSASCPR